MGTTRQRPMSAIRSDRRSCDEHVMKVGRCPGGQRPTFIAPSRQHSEFAYHPRADSANKDRPLTRRPGADLYLPVRNLLHRSHRVESLPTW